MTVDEAINVLRTAGYGVISPEGNCVANVGFFPDGSMLVSTSRKPVYGLLSVHQAVLPTTRRVPGTTYGGARLPMPIDRGAGWRQVRGDRA